MRRHLAWSGAWCLFVMAGLGACGGDGGGGAGDLPSPTRTVPSPTRTVPSPTRTLPDPSETPTAEPTEEPTDEPTDEPTREPTEEPTEEPTPTDDGPDSASPTPDEPTPTEAAEDEPAPDEDDGEDEAVSPWVWLLLALVVLAAVVTTIVLVRRARRRGAWQEQYDEAEAEVAWLARELLPQLRHATSLERVAGGWTVESGRVAAAEDRLTVLESSAPAEQQATAARTLRNAVRQARARMQQLVDGGTHDEWALDLDDVVAGLEAALPPKPAAGPTPP